MHIKQGEIFIKLKKLYMLNLCKDIINIFKITNFHLGIDIFKN
ncbi:hypothetical protein C672_0389 [[Clostridium] bifermentans ATCC 638]|uniref:Uncharacterized protein n=1 Tax=Paraclostridium bifermentans ATCC 638 = DSM 14991 TaxID=1233171 RepID=T4VUE7_PARBF|nr:hypothetical protein C672_0389 [[Clostridium] bifermentans ATCC 638] [Paraclostridium bifermentans ATCC 638 = DSM 14991]